MKEKLPKIDVVYNDLKFKILDGLLRPGEKLDSEAGLCEQYKVSRITVRNALKKLTENNFISSKSGVGHFVLSLVDLTPVEVTRKKLIYIHDISESQAAVSYLSSQIFRGSSLECSENGYNLFMASLSKDACFELFKDIKNKQFDGVIFEWNDMEIVNMFREKKVPYIIVDGAVEMPDVPYVVQDNYSGVFHALEYLYRKGHREIMYIGFADRWIHSQQRLQAYTDFHFLKKLPLNQDWVVKIHYQKFHDSNYWKPIYDIKKIPSALVFSNGELLDIFKNIMAKRNIDFRKIDIVTWGKPDDDNLDLVDGYLTWDYPIMGRMAARYLIQKISHRDLNVPVHIKLPVTFYSMNRKKLK